MAKSTNRMAWGLASILAALCLGGIWLLGVRLRPYLMARYCGEEADLGGAILTSAPLARVMTRLLAGPRALTRRGTERSGRGRAACGWSDGRSILWLGVGRTVRTGIAKALALRV